jgi:hypothetical protein
MDLARRPEECGNSGLAIVGADQPAADAGWQLGQMFRHLGAGRFMRWTLIRHVPPVLMVLPRGMPNDATDVKLYGESGYGEEMRLEVLARAGALEGPGRRSGLMPQNSPTGEITTRLPRIG